MHSGAAAAAAAVLGGREDRAASKVVDNCVAAAVNGCVWRELGNSSWKIENRAV